jgi:arabinogalactan endo-1,4-beta-galactosidase
MLDIENTGDPDGIVEWVRHAESRNVRFDVLGLSAYERWQGPSSEWPGTFGRLQETFPNPSFSIVEYNPQRRLVNDILHDLPEGRGIGTFFWEPTLSGAWGQALFEIEGNVFRARPEDFAGFDRIVDDYGL